ncbi:MAG: hypothetical protein P8P74_09800 [Crocinitomicaceae bacterium]|nr:hypothetical protein [Crocinitomicaceae bacterium]
MAFDGTEGGAITLSEGAALTKEHRLRNPTAHKGHFFGKEILNQILDQEGCMGIRFYNGQDEDGNRQLVIVGADEFEDDMLDLVGDFSAACPSNCSTPNALNS